LLGRAHEDLGAAAEVLKTAHPERAASDAYYAMFHAAEALLLSIGLEFSSHAAVHAAYGVHFSKIAKLDPTFHRNLIQAYNARITSDYDVTVKLLPREAGGAPEPGSAVRDRGRGLPPIPGAQKLNRKTNSITRAPGSFVPDTVMSR
jgi:uncharacterized protein (UPF0332 family)